MNSIKRITLISLISMIAISLLVGTTSCKKEDENITITESNIIGTWVNTADNVTLIISENNVGSYESDYYSNPPEAITWTITSSNQLDVAGTGTFAQTYEMTDESSLENVWGGSSLTKQ